MDELIHAVNPNAWPGAFVLVAFIAAGVWIKVSPKGHAHDVQHLLDALKALEDRFGKHEHECRDRREADLRDELHALRSNRRTEASDSHRSVGDDPRDGGDADDRDDRPRRR